MRTPSLGQFGVELGHLGVHAAQRLRGVLIFQHQHDAFDRVGIVVLAEDALALLMAERGAAEVAHQHRRPADLRDDDGADLRQSVDQPDAADDVALIAARHAAAAGIGVVVVDGVDDIGDAESIVLQLPGIEIELVFGGEAAEIGVIDHAGHRLQRGNHRSSAGSRTAPADFSCRTRACSGRSRRRGLPPDRATAPRRAAAPLD